MLTLPPQIMGGTDFAAMSFQRAHSDTTSQQANTLIDVVGSGYLVEARGTASGTTRIAVQIDGGIIERYDLGVSTPAMFVMRRFRTSCKVTSSISPSPLVKAIVLLD